MNELPSTAIDQIVSDNLAFAKMATNKDAESYFLARANEGTQILLARQWTRN